MDSRAVTYFENRDDSNRNQSKENAGTRIIGTGNPRTRALESGYQA